MCNLVIRTSMRDFKSAKQNNHVSVSTRQQRDSGDESRCCTELQEMTDVQRGYRQLARGPRSGRLGAWGGTVPTGTAQLTLICTR